LTANTAPVAFGAMATPILTLGKVTELPSDTLGAMVGRQTPILAVFVPLVLVVIVDGWRGLRETWPVALVCGVVFGIAQYATSNFISVPLADVVASLLSAAAVVAMVRVWRRRRPRSSRAVPPTRRPPSSRNVSRIPTIGPRSRGRTRRTRSSSWCS
jgi:lactate permease